MTLYTKLDYIKVNKNKITTLEVKAMFLVMYVDKNNSLDDRLQNRDAHIKHLESLMAEKKLIVAGGLRNDDGFEINGTMILLNTNTREEAEEIAYQDPLYKAGVFESVIIRYWKQAMPREKQMINFY